MAKANKTSNAAIQTKALPLSANMLALEPRYVFDAAMATELHTLTYAELDGHDAAPLVSATGASIVAAANELHVLAKSYDGATIVAQLGPDRAIEARIAAHNVGTSNREIAFIDSRLADLNTLVASIPDGTRIVLIDGARDGVAQMVDALKGEQGISGVHILSHGTAGNLVLGNASINTETMSTIYRSALASIGANLSADADILVYGCDFGAGAEGARSVQLLAQLTGADIAASEDVTGAATRGGDWDLETRQGLIEAGLIDAPEWNGLLAPLTISTTAQPTVSGTGDVGTTAVWTNAGFVGSTAVDLRATVITFTPGFAGATTPFFGTAVDNPFVQLTQQSTVTLRWEIFATGSNQTVTAVGAPTWTIKDIDGIGGVANTRESAAPSLFNLQSYTTEAVSNIVISGSGTTLLSSGTQDQASEPNSAVVYRWSDVQSFDVTYRLWINDPLIQARFEHDGDGDFAFVSPVTSNLLSIDLDANNTTATGTGALHSFIENGTAQPIVDADFTITQNAALGTAVDEATITLTNAQANDQFLVNGSASATGVVAGLNYAISTSGSTSTITLSGSATTAVYEAAIKAITFSNSSESPSTTNRLIDISVKNTTFGTTSNVALSTMLVVAVVDAPTIDLDGPLPVSNGTLPPSPPDNAWQVALYGGHFGVVGSTNQTATAESGASGTPTLHGVGYSPEGSVTFNDPSITISENPRYSLVASGFSYVANPTNGDYVPSNGVWTMAMSRTLTEAATITVGAPGQYFDDHAELYVNGARVDAIIGWYPSLPAGEVISYGASAGDVVEIRLTNVGNLGGFSVSLATAEQPNDLDHEVTFTEGDASVPVTLVTKADAADAENDIVLLNITAAGANDGAAERITIGDQIFALTSNATNTVTSGSTTFSIAYTTVGGFAITRSGGGLIPQADLDTLLRTISYQNISEAPTAGDRTLTFVATDSAGSTSAAAVSTIHVVPVNDTPVAADDALITGEDQAYSGTLPVATDVDGDPLTYALGSIMPAYGTVAVNPDGTYTYTPTANYNGPDSFTYTVTDGIITIEKTVAVTVTPTNDAPVAIGDSNTLSENGPAATGDVTPGTPGQDSDLDGDSLVITQVNGAALTPGSAITLPSGARLTMYANGTYSYDPNGAFESLGGGETGTDSFTYQVSDGNGGVDTATVLLTINGVNDLPIAINDTNSGTELQPLSGNVVAGAITNGSGTGGIDRDIDGDVLTVTGVNLGIIGSPIILTHGSLTIQATGAYTFVPNATANALDLGQIVNEQVIYQISDGNGGTAQATLTLTLTGQNDAPFNALSIPLSSSTDGNPVSFPTFGAFHDPDGETLTYALAPNAPAWLSIDPASGVVSGVSPANASQGGTLSNGVYTFGVTAVDPHGASVTANATVSLVNLPPIAQDDANSVGEDSLVVAGNVIADVATGDADTAPDSDPLTVTLAHQAGTPLTIGTPFITAGGGSLTLHVDGSYSFAPGTAYNGLDTGETATEMISYVVSDGNGATDTALLVITITGANDTPVVVDPANPGTPSNPLPATDPLNIIPDVSRNDGQPLDPINVGQYVVDPDGEALTFALDPATPAWLAIDPVTGQLTGTPPADASQGSNTGNPGEYLITITATDPDGAVVTTTVTLSLVNLPPVAQDDANSIGEDSLVVAGNVMADVATGDADTAPDSDPLTVTMAHQAGTPLTIGTPFITAGGGSLTLNVDGSYSFAPGTAYNGLDTGETATEMISYVVSDGNGGTDTALLVITITGANDTPVVVDGTLTTPEDQAFSGTLPVATDADGEPLTYALGAIVPTHGTISVNGDGTYTYTPADNYNGPDSFSYTVTDGTVTVEKTVAVTVTPVNDAPVAVPSVVSTNWATPVALDLIANDSDVESDPLTVISVTVPTAQGSISNVSGDWTFTPAIGFTGVATVSYTISDVHGATATSTHEIIVASPPMPIAINDYYSTGYLQPMSGDARTGDTFVAGTSFSALSQPTNGTVSFNSDGTYTYTPAAGFAGTETFVYQVTDPTGQTALAIEVIRVTPPILLAVSDSYATPYDVAVEGDAGANDTFAAGSTFNAITAPMHGTLAMNADGTFVYTPTPGFVGVDMFGYAVTDPLGQTQFATDTITVMLPPAPVAADDFVATSYLSPVAGNAATGDSYLPGATFAAVSQPTHGALVFNSDGSYTYTPATGFAGVDTFTYRVTDPTGLSATANATIAVAAPVLAAVDDAFSGAYGIPVSGNAANGDTFALGSVFDVATLPGHGSVSMNADGSYIYTPAFGFAGSDTFSYRITDPTGQTTIATETIMIIPPSLIAADDQFTAAFNTPSSGNAANGDTFAEGSTFAVSAPPAVGVVSMAPNGTYTYTPPSTFAGTVTFSYQVTDPTGQVRSAIETIVVSQPQLIAVDDSYATPFNTRLNGNAATGDTYAPGSVFSLVSSPSHGSVNMGPNGSFQYTPAAGYAGLDTFTYRITDPTGRTAIATETISIAARPAVHRCLTTFGVLRRR